MPGERSLAPPKHASDEQAFADCKPTRNRDLSRRGETREVKGDPEITSLRDKGSKPSTPQQGEIRGLLLSSLPESKQRIATTSHDAPLFSTLPSPSTEARKLVPLGLGQSSSSSTSSRHLNVEGSGARERLGQSPEVHPSKLPSDSGRYSPQSLSPRLPAMKAPPSPMNNREEETHPALSSRTGASSARRVRSVSPKRLSCPIKMDSIRSESRKDSGAGRFSPRLDAKDCDPQRDFRRRNNGLASVDLTGRKRTDAGMVAATGGHEILSEPRHRQLEPAEEKRESSRNQRLSGSKSCSRGDGRRSPRGTGLERLPQMGNSPGQENAQRSRRPSEGDLAVGRRKPSWRGSDEAHGSLAASYPKEKSPGNELAPAVDCRSYSGEEKNGGIPASPSGGRGGEISISPRTRRMRPQHHDDS